MGPTKPVCPVALWKGEIWTQTQTCVEWRLPGDNRDRDWADAARGQARQGLLAPAKSKGEERKDFTPWVSEAAWPYQYLHLGGLASQMNYEIVNFCCFKPPVGSTLFNRPRKLIYSSFKAQFMWSSYSTYPTKPLMTDSKMSKVISCTLLYPHTIIRTWPFVFIFCVKLWASLANLLSVSTFCLPSVCSSAFGKLSLNVYWTKWNGTFVFSRHQWQMT